MDEQDLWTCTIVRAHGLHLMRPERSWRPIVTVELDKTQQHETVLGSDGQNVNQKASFRLRDAAPSSHVEVKVFHRSQSKKKGKKRNLVATSSCSLGEMWKKHGQEPKLRLQCQNPNNRSVASRGRPQNGAFVHLRLWPPASMASPAGSTLIEDEEGYASSSSSSSASSAHESETLVLPPPETQLRKRRRVRGYCVNSDQEPESYSETDEEKPLLYDYPPPFDDDDDDGDGELARPPPPIKISLNPVEWIAASLLPQYTERIEVPPDPSFNFFERIISTFTVYSELCNARRDEDFEHIFGRLQLEWTYSAGLLVALAAVNTAVFSISPGSLFAISRFAASAVAASSIASGLGIACATWLLVRYAWVNLDTFITRARDVLSTPDAPSYFFFALSARMPSLLMLVSALALLIFLAIVAWSAWPTAVIVGCFIVGLLMGLQWLVFCVLWGARVVRRAVRFVVRPFMRKKDGDGVEMKVEVRDVRQDVGSEKR